MLVVLSAGDCFCCNYAVRSFCRIYADERFCSEQQTASVVAMYVTNSKFQVVTFSEWHPLFTKLTRKHLKASYQVCISPLLLIFFQNQDTLRVEIIYKSVKRVIHYFCFLDRPIKGGGIFDFQKRGILEKGGVNLEKGGYNPPYHLWAILVMLEKTFGV